MLARIRKAMEEREEGFTLIELLVVMLIIGILAAIAIPVFLSQTKQAHGTAVKSDLHQVQTTIQSVLVNSPACVGVSQTDQTVTVTPYKSDCTTADGSALTVGVTDGDSIQATSYGDDPTSASATFTTNDGTYCVDMEYNTDTTTEWNLKVDSAGNTTLNSGACS